jgi:hypothetical protein
MAVGSAMICSPAQDGGTDAEGSLGDGSDGPSPGDASVSDVASPGDASSQSDGASDGDSGKLDVVEAGSADG